MFLCFSCTVTLPLQDCRVADSILSSVWVSHVYCVSVWVSSRSISYMEMDWISCTKLQNNVYECVKVCVMNCCLIRVVLLPSIQCSWDRLWLHIDLDQEKELTEGKYMNEFVLNTHI